MRKVDFSVPVVDKENVFTKSDLRVQIIYSSISSERNLLRSKVTRSKCALERCGNVLLVMRVLINVF